MKEGYVLASTPRCDGDQECRQVSYSLFDGPFKACLRPHNSVKQEGSIYRQDSGSLCLRFECEPAECSSRGQQFNSKCLDYIELVLADVILPRR